MPMPATRSRGESCATPPSRSTIWCADSPSTARPVLLCSAVSHRRCSHGWRRMCSAGWFPSKATRWTAPCISPGARPITNNEGVMMRTEQIDPRYADLDSWSAAEMIAAMYEGQLAAAGAVRGALGPITKAVEDAVPALRRGGRIVYVGAGTSARIGVQDGSELLPTYDWPADRVVFVIAGGLDALVRSIEGAEDNDAAGTEAITNAKIGADDVVIGIAASGTTPFTIAALRGAHAAGAVTIAVANNADAPIFAAARHPILVETGSEAVAGSTRMNAGTAQKIVLNLFSTAVMVKMGRVYRGLMVDMRARNAKLRRRAEAMVSEIVRCPEGDAARYLEQADGHVKTAVLLGLGLSRSEAAQLLQRHGGNLRSAINETTNDNG